MTSASQIQTILGAYHPGDQVSIGWTDAYGQSQTATVTLANGRPPEAGDLGAARARLGATTETGRSRLRPASLAEDDAPSRS